MVLHLVPMLVALNFTLDHGRLLRAQQDLMIRTIPFMLEVMLRGGLQLLTTLEELADGPAAGGSGQSRELTSFERLTPVQQAFHEGYDAGWMARINATS